MHPSIHCAKPHRRHHASHASPNRRGGHGSHSGRRFRTVHHVALVHLCRQGPTGAGLPMPTQLMKKPLPVLSPRLGGRPCHFRPARTLARFEQAAVLVCLPRLSFFLSLFAFLRSDPVTPVTILPSSSPRAPNEEITRNDPRRNSPANLIRPPLAPPQASMPRT